MLTHQLMQLLASGSAPYANLLAYPLTYDFEDHNGANALFRATPTTRNSRRAAGWAVAATSNWTTRVRPRG